MPAKLTRSRRLLSIAVTSVTFIALMSHDSAHAQTAEAEVQFNNGVQLLEQGKVAQACAAFLASNRIEPRAGTLIRLGECRERNQQLASAWFAYKDALARVKDPHKREVATARAAALEPRLSHLTVLVSDESRIAGLVLSRNGRPLEPKLWNRALPVDGGDYTITGCAPGYEDWQIAVHVTREGAKVSAMVPRLRELARPGPHAPPPSGGHEVSPTIQAREVMARKPEDVTQVERAPSDRIALDIHRSERNWVGGRPWAPWKPWAVLGAGAGLAAAGGVLHILAAHNFNAFDNRFLNLPCSASWGGCPRQALDPSLSARLSRARLEQKIAIGGYIAGGASITIGLALLYLNRPRHMEREDATSTAEWPAITPVVSPDMFGVVVTNMY